jgi:cytochrome c oxidase subunit 2
VNELLRRLLHLPPQGSSVARGIDALHYTVILTTFAGVALVALVTVSFAIRYRRRDDRPTVRPPRAGRFEAGVIVALLAVFCGWWVVGFAQYRTLQTPPADALPIYVTAKQWMWQFADPAGPTTINTLTVPVGRPVKLIMTSRDVIHGFYVPAFRIKQDVVPGRAVTVWFEAVAPGTYDVLCTQYCGTRHSEMRAQVIALAPDTYAHYLGASRGKGDGRGLAARGREVAAARGCLRCHSTDGTPFAGPTWAGAYGRPRLLSDGRTVAIDEAYLTESMMDPNAAIAAGFPPVMPSYQGVLTPAETAAILEYIRSLADAAPVRPAPPPTAPFQVAP